MKTITNTASEMTLDLEMKAHNQMEMKNIMEMMLKNELEMTEPLEMNEYLNRNERVEMNLQQALLLKRYIDAYCSAPIIQKNRNYFIEGKFYEKHCLYMKSELILKFRIPTDSLKEAQNYHNLLYRDRRIKV